MVEMAMLQVGFILVASTFRYTQANGDLGQGFCPPQSTTLFQNDSNETTVEGSARRECACDLKPCLPICPYSSIAQYSRRYVIDDYVNYSLIPRIFETTSESFDDVADAAGPDPRELFDIIVWRPCPEVELYAFEPTSNENHEFRLLRNGSLFLPKVDDPIYSLVKDFTEYCLVSLPSEQTYVPVFCYTEPPRVFITTLDEILYIGYLLAVPFIVATVFVYSVLPEFRNIHGTTLRCYLCCLAVSNVAFGVSRLRPREFDTCDSSCLCLGFFIYFSSIAYFSWLNVMCFDLWRRFGGLSFIGISDFQNERNKFLWYSIYVWSVSVLTTVVCVAMELAPGIPESFIRPGFKETAGWFSEAAVSLYYFGPTGLSICFNVCLFVSTSLKLCQHEKKMRRDFDTGDSGCHNHNKNWFGVHLRLFVVMGVTWSTDTISWFCPGPDYLWFLPDMVNGLQGIFVFLILVCKKSVWLSLKKRYGKKISRGTDQQRVDYVRSSRSSEDSMGVRSIPSQSFTRSSQLTSEVTLN